MLTSKMTSESEGASPTRGDGQDQRAFLDGRERDSAPNGRLSPRTRTTMAPTARINDGGIPWKHSPTGQHHTHGPCNQVQESSDV
jgi:hypothetical protein